VFCRAAATGDQFACLHVGLTSSLIGVLTACSSIASSAIPWNYAAKVVSQAAGILCSWDQCAGSSASSSSSKPALCSQQQQQLLLSQLLTAAQLLIGQGTDAACHLSNSELQWLSWHLTHAAMGRDGSSARSSSSSSSSDTGCSHRGAAPDLLLLAWHCSCSQLRSGNCSGIKEVLAMLQQAYTYVNMVWRSSSSSGGESCNDDGDADTQAPEVLFLQQHLASVQQVVLLTLVELMQQQQQQDGAVALLVNSSSQQQLEKLLKAYSKLRCSCAAAAAFVEPTAHACTAAGSSNSSKAGKSRTASNSQQQQIVQEQYATATGGSCLPSALQLVLQHVVTDDSSSNCDACLPLPLDILAWKECKALLSVADDPRLRPGATSAAVEQLLQELCSCGAPAGWDAAVFSAQAQLVRGMMMQACSSSVAAAENSLHNQSAAAAAAAMLSGACEQWLALLCQPAAAAAAAAKSSGRRRAGSKSSNSKSRAAAAPQVPSQAELAAGAEDLQAKLGVSAAAQALASAALSHCLLGLLEAAAALDQHSSSSVAGCAAVDAAAGQDAVWQSQAQDQDATAGNSDAPTAADSSSMSCDSDCEEACISDAGGVSDDVAVEEFWGLAAQHLHTSAQLFELLLEAAGQEAGSSSNCSSSLHKATFQFPAEAAAAVVQAWHIAGLQGWGCCQQAYAGVLTALVPLLPAQQQSSLQHVQQLLVPCDVAGVSPWLGLLLAPQRLLPVASCSNDVAAADSAAAATICGKKAKGRGAPAAASSSSSSQGPLCKCSMQAERAALDAATQQLPQHTAGAATPASNAQQLQQVQLLLASAQVAAAAGANAAALVEAEAALELCKAVVAATSCGSSQGGRRSVAATSGLNGSHWLFKLSSSAGLYWHALGHYMSGLLQLAEVHESCGNPEDALRALKELLKLSSSCHCCYLAAVAQASISSIHSKMGQVKEADAAAAGAARWLLRFQQRQAVMQQDAQQQQQQLQPLECTYAAAAVAQARAACSAADSQHADAQQQLSAAIQQLADALPLQDSSSTDASQEQRPLCMLRWRAVGLQAQLQLQLAHVEVLLQGMPAASICLQAALQDLAASGGVQCDRYDPARCCRTITRVTCVT
jgi:hypothetical protein